MFVALRVRNHASPGARWPTKPQRGEASEGPSAGYPRYIEKIMRVDGFWLGLTLTVVAAGCSSESSEDESGSELVAEVTQSAASLARNALTKQQAGTVLELIDDICGDTWCEGDHDFHFDRIQCQRACSSSQAGSCQLTFRIFPHDTDLETGPSYLRTCQTPGFTGFGSLVDTATDGYQSLAWEYYDALSACISDLESTLPAFRP